MNRTHTRTAAPPDLVREDLAAASDEDLLRATMAVYGIPSLAAWRAAELKVLRDLRYEAPLLEIGCGSGKFSSLLLSSVDCGIDLNPREVALCRANGTHRSVYQMDARTLAFPDASFATVFANCVIEHIPGLPDALREFRRVLRPGGRMVTTVPTDEINGSLLFRSASYASMRARQLQHVNLLSPIGWIRAFTCAGFTQIHLTPYLSSDFCRAWDGVDGPISVALGPLRVSRAYRLLKSALPSRIQEGVDSTWRKRFLPHLGSTTHIRPVAFLIEAFVD